jgi:hypothetical protein
MTRIEVIEMIGDVLTDIDIARGSLMPNDPNRHKLDDLRLLLDDKQRKLSQAVFDENGQSFQSAAQNLKTINDQISGTITSINDMATTLANITRFLNAAASLVSLIPTFV